MIEYEMVTCPSCEGKCHEMKNSIKYFKTAKEISTVACKWCMDAGEVKQRKQ